MDFSRAFNRNIIFQLIRKFVSMNGLIFNFIIIYVGLALVFSILLGTLSLQAQARTVINNTVSAANSSDTDAVAGSGYPHYMIPGENLLVVDQGDPVNISCAKNGAYGMSQRTTANGSTSVFFQLTVRADEDSVDYQPGDNLPFKTVMCMQKKSLITINCGCLVDGVARSEHSLRFLKAGGRPGRSLLEDIMKPICLGTAISTNPRAYMWYGGEAALKQIGYVSNCY